MAKETLKKEHPFNRDVACRNGIKGFHNGAKKYETVPDKDSITGRVLVQVDKKTWVYKKKKGNE